MVMIARIKKELPNEQISKVIESYLSQLKEILELIQKRGIENLDMEILFATISERYLNKGLCYYFEHYCKKIFCLNKEEFYESEKALNYFFKNNCPENCYVSTDDYPIVMSNDKEIKDINECFLFRIDELAYEPERLEGMLKMRIWLYSKMIEKYESEL